MRESITKSAKMCLFFVFFINYEYLASHFNYSHLIAVERFIFRSPSIRSVGGFGRMDERDNKLLSIKSLVLMLNE